MLALLTSLKHGVGAGAVGGALTGAFGVVLAEPVMDRAVRLESARTAAEQARRATAGLPVEHHAEVFSRHTQHLGFVVAAVGTGVAVGVLFGVLYAVLHPEHRRAADPWGSALRLAAAGWFGVYLVPFLRYPANPPGVGDPGTIDGRTHTYLAAIVIGVVGALTATLLRRDLVARGRSTPLRQLAVTTVLVLTVALTFILPANPDAIDVPASLLWEFRLLAFASSTLLWSGLAVTFGLLAHRAQFGGTPAAGEVCMTLQSD